MLDSNRLRRCVKDFDFENLFIEELGWDHHTQSLDVTIDDQTFMLSAVAQKRGVIAFACVCNIPVYAIRRKIEQQVTKSVREHIIIFIDRAKTIQIWQWVKRELGKPTACREHQYYHTQSGELLIQKLRTLAFSLEEEEELNLFGVVDRVSSALDVERVTRKFYDRFKTEHAKFLDFIEGIPDEDLQRWYASVMLNRLMFIYFIQKKGFIDNDTNYLITKLAQSKQRGKDRFYTDFICPLFFEGFAKKENERSPETRKLLGKVPYLNGGIFLKHQIEEQCGEKISIPDSAFERLFNFFGQYNWHLDERPLRRDDEINPDVLGYIFEKYINQKQMGAYYTKEDITEYISKNTIIPSLFDTAQKKCKIAFTPPTDNSPDMSVWRLLQSDPDRYIYDAVKKGVELPLPENIAIGLNDVSKRTDWNKSAPGEYALPTEIWREVVARRKRYEEVHAKLANGEINDINDFITYNLNIRQFAQDVIENCEGPELLRAFWQAITQITVLDPTCGSGAFLFAALNILDSLYEACIDRMESFVSELDRSGEKHHPEKYSDFRKVLERMSEHPNQRYFILKSIMVNNLYGVDIMDEAIEICKLRMFLKLVAQVDNVDKIEPLPDIDFNVRAGNTLVGYASLDEVRKTLEETLGYAKKEVDKIEEKAQDLDGFFKIFQEMQTEQGMSPQDFTEAKLEVRQRMKTLEDELNRYLAKEYGVDVTKQETYDKWLASHKPFHWFIDFYGIIKIGGFDVIIGNPPYVEYRKVKREYAVRGYETEDCGNLYAFAMERSLSLIKDKARFGMIVPSSASNTDGYISLQNIIIKQSHVHISSYSDQRGKLFDIPHPRLCIIIYKKEPKKCEVRSTLYIKIGVGELRDKLFQRLDYSDVAEFIKPGIIPRYSSRNEMSINRKLYNQARKIGNYVVNAGNNKTYYTRKISWFVQVTSFVPEISKENGELREPSELKTLVLASSMHADICFAILNSNLFYWYVTTNSDCRNLNMREVLGFPINIDSMQQEIQSRLKILADHLTNSLKAESEYRDMTFNDVGILRIQCIFPGRSKPIIDEIDRVIAEHYGFTDEELDFIINYDIKYRMDRDSEEEEDE
jgi:methylase of polypeptide subunit release factors